MFKSSVQTTKFLFCALSFLCFDTPAFSASDNNPRIIAEMLARLMLAERLAHLYEHDKRFSSGTRRFELWWFEQKISLQRKSLIRNSPT